MVTGIILEDVDKSVERNSSLSSELKCILLRSKQSRRSPGRRFRRRKAEEVLGPGVQGHVLEGEFVSGRPLANSCIAITRSAVIRLMCEGC